MGAPDIFLEHRKGEKVQKVLRVNSERKIFVIGASKEADLKIFGDGIQGVHAVLKLRDDGWHLCDVSGTESLKVNGKIVTEAKLDASAKVEIAGHKLQLFARERETELFKGEIASGALSHHQVVVRVKGRVLETHVLAATESYKWVDGEQRHVMPAPTSSKWQETKIGVRTIQQRLVSTQELATAEKMAVDEDLRKPFLMAFAAFLLLIVTATLLTNREEKAPEIALDQKSKDIIFDAKIIKKKKLESQKVVKLAKGRSGGTGMDSPKTNAKSNLPDESMAPKISQKTTQALTSLRNSGLSSLIGKIAKRANKQNMMVAAVGVSPDVATSGRALFSTGTSTTGGGGSASKEGPSFRLGGVGTRGKAGGVGNFKDGTALAGGSVGTGNVMALSDDEETSIEGGLDRDAIAEVIKRNLGQIRYCYERQLSSNPELYGKVLVKFTIGADGTITTNKVDNTTLKSDMVEGCIMRRMSSWKFPLPKGGTQVRVSYPFLFKAMQ